MSKKGVSTGYAWIFGLVSLFALGILYITFAQVFDAYMVPTIKNQVNSTAIALDEATKAEINNGIDKYMDFFHTIPFILFFIVVIYMIVVAVRKERESEFM